MRRCYAEDTKRMDDAIREQLDAMKAEHRRLDEQISALSANPLSDQLEIARL